jgi:hypothetical protein
MCRPRMHALHGIESVPVPVVRTTAFFRKRLSSYRYVRRTSSYTTGTFRGKIKRWILCQFFNLIPLHAESHKREPSLIDW